MVQSSVICLTAQASVFLSPSYSLQRKAHPALSPSQSSSLLSPSHFSELTTTLSRQPSVVKYVLILSQWYKLDVFVAVSISPSR